jgi:hypothetical protein
VINMDKLAAMFGSASEVARVAGVNRSSAVRWRRPNRNMRPEYKARLLREAKRLHLPLHRVEAALAVERCPVCGTPHDKKLRRVLR